MGIVKVVVCVGIAEVETALFEPSAWGEGSSAFADGGDEFVEDILVAFEIGLSG